eukprot:CAMPEP_0116952280 /NCGR_PEP_ID=MMETSP0467-20121206/40636_1 /TAXON_ID=283647 /ORGANISM="Mesodinium pulex, Strain SPMC105" /LENGTH=65 /DNA_ID=CAMNT_0004637517 /DNA_START=399 /DNA_END=596 /DNA_ORIENTATION=-
MNTGKKLVNDDLPYIQGNFEVGFKHKSTFKEETLEDRLNRKGRVDEKKRKNGFIEKGLPGGNNFR